MNKLDLKHEFVVAGLPSVIRSHLCSCLHVSKHHLCMFSLIWYIFMYA
jgi:hypothetical protein